MWDRVLFSGQSLVSVSWINIVSGSETKNLVYVWRCTASDRRRIKNDRNVERVRSKRTNRTGLLWGMVSQNRTKTGSWSNTIHRYFMICDYNVRATVCICICLYACAHHIMFVVCIVQAGNKHVLICATCNWRQNFEALEGGCKRWKVSDISVRDTHY